MNGDHILDADGNPTETVSNNEAPALIYQDIGYDTGEYASGFGQSGVPHPPSRPGMTYYPVDSTYPAAGPQPIWLDDLRCAVGGTEPSAGALPTPMAHCGYAGWGLHNCTHREDAGVRCWNEGGTLGNAKALKARFVSPPERHDGTRQVRLQVAFSEAIDESPENVGEHGVRVEGGEVTGVRRVGGAPKSAARSTDAPRSGEQVWEFEIEPGSDDDLTVRIDAGRSCDEPGAGALSEGISTTVHGPDPVPLTAAFEGVPEEHDCEDAFRFRVAFSEDIGIGFKALRDDAFTVTGGGVTKAKRVDGRNDLWEITVEPGSDEAMTIALPGGRECAVSGAVCTRGENRRQLANTPTATVAGPVDEAAPAALTASFVQVPAEHDGKTAFKLRIGFSEGISIGYRTFRDQSLSVSGGGA